MEDMATFLAYGITRVAVRSAKAVRLVPVNTARIRAKLAEPAPDAPSGSTTSTASSPPQDLPQHPDHPDESVPVGERLPQAYAEWERLARQPFKAGVHGPVRLPIERELPTTPVNHVLVPYNAVSKITGADADDMPDTHAAFITRKTAEEVRLGSIEEVTDWKQVRVLLPVFVVAHPVTGKLRIIYDGRALNTYLVDAKGSVNYEDLRDALLLRAKVATKLDLQSAFRHVRIAEDQQDLFGFTFGGRVYRYTCLPFGCSWSPALYARMLAPAIAAIRRLGIRILWYVDDILVVAESREELDAALARVMALLHKHGWKVAPDKTYCYAYTVIPFLGMKVRFDDSANGAARLSVPRAKRDRVVTELRQVLDSGHISITRLQSLTGKLNFIRIVITELGFIRSSFDGAIAAAQHQGSPNVPVIGRVREDAMAILGLFSDDTILRRETPLHTDYTTRHLIYSDASAFGWGVLQVDSRGPFQGPPGTTSAPGWSRTGTFSPAEIALSSAAREIRAITYGIIDLDLRDAALMWHSDSTSAVAAISRWASSSPGVAEALAELFSELSRRNLSIDIIHVRRELELMPVADWLSRRGWRDRQAEWALAKDDMLSICRCLNLACSGDLFASARNHHFPVFCSRFLEVGSRGDAMFASWWDRPWWAFPPRSLRSRILQRLVSYLHVARASHSKRQSRRTLNLILLINPISPSDPDSSLWQELLSAKAVIRSVVVFDPSLLSAPASPPPRHLLPTLRLVGDQGRPARGPPPWALVAHRIHIGAKT